MLKNYKELKVWQKSYQLCLRYLQGNKKVSKRGALRNYIPDKKSCRFDTV